MSGLMWAVIASVAVMLSSCSDVLENPDATAVEEGLPAQVVVNLTMSDADRLSRGDIHPGLDFRVNTLWVAVYNVRTGARTGLVRLAPAADFTSHRLRSITIDALSGPSYIVAVANYNNRYATVDDSGTLMPMASALDAADTWDKYTSITAAFDQQGGVNIEAPLNALMMSGYYTAPSHTDGSRPELSQLNITPGMSTPSGAIHLRRLISQVKFNVKINQDNVNSCAVEWWRVNNLPAHTWVHERADGDDPVNASDARAARSNRYLNSLTMTEFSATGATTSFDFWMLENKRTGREPGDGYDNSNAYTYREREYKAADGSNTGKYVSLVDGPESDDYNNSAAFVTFHVDLDMKVDENGNPLTGLVSRRVETDYTIHLGYIEGGTPLIKARDFNCRRNTLYTYDITINNVNDVLVEARREGEPSPGVEGFVSDIIDYYYELDAHYGQFNIQLTASDISSFEYMVTAPRLDGTEIAISSTSPASVPQPGSDDYKYLEWVELRPTTRESVMAAYKPRTGDNADGQTYTLDQVKGKLSPGWYTVFVNEYVYEDGTYASGNEAGSTAWHNYTNIGDRHAWLNVSRDVADDGNSVHYRSKYAMAQKSIQTYYVNSSPSGLGVEHENESLGLNLNNNYNADGDGNVNSGRFNLAYHLAGNSKWSTSTSASWTWRDNRYRWSNFLTLTTAQSVNAINNQGITRAARTEFLPEIKTISGSGTTYDPDRTSSPKYIEAITACLNRNRDLDGDGYIDASEIRWFVPTLSQYVRIILGRRSLQTPVLTVEDFPKLAYTVNDYNSALLFYTSNGRQLWAMEGTSDSKWREWGGGAPWDVRCVRNLGGDMTVINDHNVTLPAFGLREGTTHVVDMDHYDAKSIRTEAYFSSDMPMPPHHIYDQRYNRCYLSFEVAEDKYDIYYSDIDDFTLNTDWVTYLSTHNPCKGLVAKTGKDGWRVPNQKELTIMTVLGLAPTAYTYTYSCSVSYYDLSGYAIGSNPSDPDGTLTYAYRHVMKATDSGKMTQGGDKNAFGIRCVRDYIE